MICFVAKMGVEEIRVIFEIAICRISCKANMVIKEIVIIRIISYFLVVMKRKENCLKQRLEKNIPILLPHVTFLNVVVVVS